MDKLKDEELVYYVRMGKREARELLFFRYEKKMGRIMCNNGYVFNKFGYTYEDYKMIIWECVEKAINNFLYTEGNFYSYCHLYVRTKIIDASRKKGYDDKAILFSTLEEETTLDGIYEFRDSSIDYDATFDVGELYEKIDGFGKDYLDVIKLYCSGLSYEEIADQLSISKKRISNILMAVRKRLKDEYFGE